MPETNAHGQPVGDAVPDWTPAQPVRIDDRRGRYATVEHLDVERHLDDLAARLPADDAMWTYLGYGPFRTTDTLRTFLAPRARETDPWWCVIRAADGVASGFATLLRIDREHGCIEIGHIVLGTGLAGTRAGFEGIHLLMQTAFDLGYRRLEWKCDALNRPSNRAAERIGFRFEGTFRNHRVVRGRNRDSAWYSITDAEWPAVRTAHERWLEPANFDDDGRQRTALRDLTAPLRAHGSA